MNSCTSRSSRRRAVDAFCRQCGAQEAGSNWREHVAVCPCTQCELWPVRPLSANASDWMRARDRTQIPAGWTELSRASALGELRKTRVESLGIAETAILEVSEPSQLSASHGDLASSGNSETALRTASVKLTKGSKLDGTP